MGRRRLLFVDVEARANEKSECIKLYHQASLILNKHDGAILAFPDPMPPGDRGERGHAGPASSLVTDAPRSSLAGGADQARGGTGVGDQSRGEDAVSCDLDGAGWVRQS